MRIWRTTQTALRALAENPMRATLTTLGILIGMRAVIAKMETGAGSSPQIRKGICSVGPNVVLIMPGTASTAGVNLGSGPALAGGVLTSGEHTRHNFARITISFRTYAMAVERVERRLRRVTAALDAAGIRYAVVGG